MTIKSKSEPGGTQTAVDVVDVDVHPYLQHRDELAPYLAEPWRSREFTSHRPAVYSRPYPVGLAPDIGVLSPPAAGMRLDSLPPSGLPAGADDEFVRTELANMGVDYSILIPLFARPKASNEYESALHSAVNEWLADTWLTKYNRNRQFRGMIRVSPDDVPRAVAEIEKWAEHPEMVSVMLHTITLAPLGQPRFWPIYEAAVRHDLPISIHGLRATGGKMRTPVGPQSYHSLFLGQMPLVFMSHLASFLLEGVFEEFPSMKLAMIEGGLTWVPPFLWRLDQHWERFRRELPKLKRAPSEYVGDHVRFSTQPFDEPDKVQDLIQMLDWMDASRLLMFATDYPHHDADNPDWVRRRLPEYMRSSVMRDNAVDFYGMPATRPMANSGR